MRKITEVLRLRYDLGFAYRQIASSCMVGLGTVSEYLKRAEAAGLKWPLPDGMTDDQLHELLFGGHRPVHQDQSMPDIPVEVNPYGLALAQDGRKLYVTNWASASVSVIDTSSLKVVSTIPTGPNPNDLALSRDGRLFVACANDDSITVIDTKSGVAMERISTALTPNAPEGATPNALTLDNDGQLLFVANADNNDMAVVNIGARGKSEVLGFIPAAWYPSAVAVASKKLLVGNSKGLGSYPDPNGLNSPLNARGDPERSLRSLRQGALGIVSIADLAKAGDEASTPTLAMLNVRLGDLSQG